MRGLPSLRTKIVVLFAGALAVCMASSGSLAGSPSADDGTCGIKLVLKNPDLQEAADGFIHASGWFFIQFQAVGAGAERVKSFAFSFGKPAPDGTVQCNTPAGSFTGAYILNYRGDYTPEDGFFVPINTTLVSDGEYGAAVHAYDAPNAQGNELGRFYAKAKVENGCSMPRCQDKTVADIIKNDKVLPWPRVLPGDGIQTNKVAGLTIEFAENVVDVHAYLNGNETFLSQWEGVPMDDDATPGNDNTACGSTPPPACVKRVWGPAFQWLGPIQQNDVIRVTAVDLNGNRVEKIIHLLDPTQGGIVSSDSINIDVQVDNFTKSTGPQQQANFEFTFISVSTQDAHVNLGLVFDETRLEGGFFPDHVVVPAGKRAQASLFLTPKPGVTSGTFDVKATPTWRSEGQDVSKTFDLKLIVGQGLNPSSDASPSPTGNETANPAGGNGSPGAGLAAAVGAVLVASAAFVRRIRRSP